MITMRQGVLLGLLGVAALGTLYAVPKLYEDLDASHVMVIQSPVSGDLAVFTDPGVKWQGFGQVTKYPRRGTYSFELVGMEDSCKHVQFNDGGKANLCGSVQWEMPLAPKEVIALHKAYGSPEAIDNGAVGKMLDAAIYFAGPTMGSIESTAERRADLLHYISDQAEKGVYVTRTVHKKITDPTTNSEREVIAAEIVVDDKGVPRRQQGSILQDFGIKLLPISISQIKYDGVVEKQIAKRQEATNEVQIAQANARKAEQEKLTVEAQGAANAAKAKWEQETIKAKLVTEAEQKLRVAELAAREAEQYKRSQILIGEGDAQRKQLVMNADGALDQKLRAYIEVNEKYAEAIRSAQPGAWSPVVLNNGGGSANGASNAATLIDLFTAKAARDLGLDLSVLGKSATAPGKKP